MGRTMLFLGVMIMLSVVALLRLRDGGGEQTDSDAAPHLVQRDGEWRSAFPAGDLGLRKAVAAGTPAAEKELQAMAADWRPWRAYAAMLLWQNGARRPQGG